LIDPEVPSDSVLDERRDADDGHDERGKLPHCAPQRATFATKVDGPGETGQGQRDARIGHHARLTRDERRQPCLACHPPRQPEQTDHAACETQPSSCRGDTGVIDFSRAVWLAMHREQDSESPS
jgi:hypothetical protein